MNDCAKCGGLCCKGIAGQVQGEDTYFLDWAKTRGDIIDGVWYIDAPCKHFVQCRCAIYNTRPKVCRDYKVGGPDCLATRKALGDHKRQGDGR